VIENQPRRGCVHPIIGIQGNIEKRHNLGLFLLILDRTSV